jgi:hypothetical protein
MFEHRMDESTTADRPGARCGEIDGMSRGLNRIELERAFPVLRGGLDAAARRLFWRRHQAYMLRETSQSLRRELAMSLGHVSHGRSCARS